MINDDDDDNDNESCCWKLQVAAGATAAGGCWYDLLTPYSEALWGGGQRPFINFIKKQENWYLVASLTFFLVQEILLMKSIVLFSILASLYIGTGQCVKGMASPPFRVSKVNVVFEILFQLCKV